MEKDYQEYATPEGGILHIEPPIDVPEDFWHDIRQETWANRLLIPKVAMIKVMNDYFNEQGIPTSFSPIGKDFKTPVEIVNFREDLIGGFIVELKKKDT